MDDEVLEIYDGGDFDYEEEEEGKNLELWEEERWTSSSGLHSSISKPFAIIIFTMFGDLCFWYLDFYVDYIVFGHPYSPLVDPRGCELAGFQLGCCGFPPLTSSDLIR